MIFTLNFQGHSRSNITVPLPLDSPCMFSYSCLIATYGLTRFLYEIKGLEIPVTFNLAFQCHSRANVMVELVCDFLLMSNSNI